MSKSETDWTPSKSDNKIDNTNSNLDGVNVPVPEFYNQYFDLKDEPGGGCGRSTCGDITKENPDDIGHWIQKNYIYKDKNGDYHPGDRQNEDNLIDYLRKRGNTCNRLTVSTTWWNGYPKGHIPTEGDFKAMINALDRGYLVFYHWMGSVGHYLLLKGYIRDAEGNYTFIFYDSAGDEKLDFRNRTRESGKDVLYSRAFLEQKRIYGSCWEVIPG
jgi:hypothetical protein